MKLNIAFFASHNGSNMQAIIDTVLKGQLNAELCCLITNNSKSYSIERAKNTGMKFYHISSVTHPDEIERDNAIIDELKENGADTIVLAGYMKKISQKVIESVGGRVLNIHPALLPKFGGEGMYGMNVHKAIIEAGEKESGASIHLVDSEYDRGRVIAQMKVEVSDDDTPDTLADKVLKIEHILYSDTLIKISNGEITIP